MESLDNKRTNLQKIPQHFCQEKKDFLRKKAFKDLWSMHQVCSNRSIHVRDELVWRVAQESSRFFECEALKTPWLKNVYKKTAWNGLKSLRAF